MNKYNSCAIILHDGGDKLKSIKVLRIKAGKTQEELAKACGVTQGAVAQWETGATSPQIGKLLDIAQCLDCSVADLLNPGDAE